MIIEIPILNATPSNTGGAPKLVLSSEYTLQYLATNAVIFYCIMPATYVAGHSIDVDLLWSPSGSVTSYTWGVSFQKLAPGTLISTYNFGTERTTTTSSPVSSTYAKTTVNLPIGDLGSILPNTLFRIKVKLVTLVGSGFARLGHVCLNNGS